MSHSFCAEFFKKGIQSNIFLMIMITTFLLVLIIWWSIILKKLLKTLDQELLITKIIEKQKIYITFNHVLYPEVPIEDLKLRMEDYQLLSEITIITGVNYDRATWKINLKNC